MPSSPIKEKDHTPASLDTANGRHNSEDEFDSAEDDMEEAEGEEEFVVALHDFASNNATCLSFNAGQVIKVFNRDESGWWDGELDGQRGWFPSNYVDDGGGTSETYGDASEEPIDSNSYAAFGESAAVDETSSEMQMHRDAAPISTSSTSDDSSGHHPAQIHDSAHRSGTANPSRSPTPTADRIMQRSNNAYTSQGPVIQHPRPQQLPQHLHHRHTSNPKLHAILNPIHHAISLLHNAARARRLAHFQPSTACVISSVRSVLSATDCLTRESPMLKAHPVLARERKQILAELSKLVTQARKASAPATEDDVLQDEMDVMLVLADNVLRNVRRFLEVAEECGIQVPDVRSAGTGMEGYYEDGMARTEGNNSMIGAPRASGMPDRGDQDKTPTPESPRRTSYLAASSPDAHSLRSSVSHADLHSATASSLNSTLAQNGFEGPGSHSRSTYADVSFDRASSQSAGSHGEARHNYSDPSPSPPTECTPDEVLDHIHVANDHLLSIIAAFIGHIHGHSRDSHASSYAFLIDMTRATVDGVRNLLVVVEAVHVNRVLQQTLPRPLSILWETRESVYEATAALVTAARVMTAAQPTTLNGTVRAEQTSTEAEEKSRLLQAATTVLRTGGECVGAVKMCLNRADANLRVVLSSAPLSTPAQALTNADEEAGERHLEEAEEYQGAPGKNGRHGKHTLSYLGRKATSLSCLRERYEQAGGASPLANRSSTFSDIDEDSTGTEGDASGGQHTGSSMEERSGVTQETGSGGHASDSSEGMSRQHSRASASTLHSARSDMTPDTSARPSMDRSGDLAGAQSVLRASHDETPPLSAPILGSYPRDKGTLQKPHLRNRSVSQPRHEEPVSPSSPTPVVPTQRSTSDTAPMRERATDKPALQSADESIMDPDYDPSDVCYNSEGQLTGATVKALVEKMTPHRTTIDATLSTAFFLCFRLFTTPMELFETLEARYNMRPPYEIETNADDLARWMEVKAAPVRLRVFNFFKLWLENNWNATTDYVILEPLIRFTQTSMTHTLHRPGQRLAEIAQKRLGAGKEARATVMAVSSANNGTIVRGPGSLKRVVSSDRPHGIPGLTELTNLYTAGSFPSRGPSSPPAPVISKTLMAQLKSGEIYKINVMDIDALELARQLTIMESRIYCSILPEELLGQEFSKKAGVSGAVHVKSMSSLSTHVTGWVSECILGEEDARKRTQIIRFFIKLGDRCLALHNYNALFAVQGALNSSTIARLKRTWDGLPTKYRTLMEQQRYLVEHTRNFAAYRQQLRSIHPPALPFVGLFLTDLTFCDDGNAATRLSPADSSKHLLNFDKYVKTSRIIGELQRFQQPYALLEVPEMQHYLRVTLQEKQQQGKSVVSAEDLYNRSLRLEPRSSHGTQGGVGGEGNASSGTLSLTGRSGMGGVSLDIFNWK